LGEFGEPDDLIENGRVDSDACEPGRIHARKHGDCDDEGACAPVSCRGLGCSVACRLHHLQAARGVDVDHPDAKRRRGSNGASDRIWNVMELEVEKDPVTTPGELAHDLRSFGGEEPAADLESAGDTAQPIREGQGVPGVVDVERD
jgi:hypothetical protein